MSRRRPPPPDAPRLVRDRAVLFLEAQDAPQSSTLLAREILGLRRGSESSCAAILASVLSGDPRLARTEDGRWTLGEPAPAAAADPALRQRTWAVWAVAGTGRAVAVVRIEAGRLASERAEPAQDDEDAALAAPSAGEAPLSRAAWRRLADLAAGALSTSFEGAGLVERGLAGAAAVRYGETRGTDDDAQVPLGFLPLSALARAALRPPRPRTLESLAASLGIAFVEDESPLARARLSAECLLTLLEREPLRDRGEEGLRALLGTRAAPPPALDDPAGALRRDLESLPTEPGVYRFFDREGRLLYVGKARNLRVRVGSYFAARERPDPRTATWLGSVIRIEHDRAGSELEALLREADQIAHRGPVNNRQRTVHARTGRAVGDLVLVQIAERTGSVRLALVKDGALAARVVLGPRGGGRTRLRALVEEIYFSSAPLSRPSRPSRPPGPPRPPRTSGGAAREASRALLLSWLRQQPPGVPALDPTDDPGPDEACARIQAYASALRRGEMGVTFR
jgi:hypothetical protein